MSCYFRRNINPMLVLLLRLCGMCREHLKIHPLQIQKVEGLGIYKKKPNLRAINSLCWKTVKWCAFDRKECHLLERALAFEEREAFQELCVTNSLQQSCPRRACTDGLCSSTQRSARSKLLHGYHKMTQKTHLGFEQGLEFQ